MQGVDTEVEQALVAVDTGKVLGHSVSEEGKYRVKQGWTFVAVI